MSNKVPPQSSGAGEPEPFQEEWLTAFLDDELSAQQRATVLQRLALDPSAKSKLAELQEIRGLLSGLPSFEGQLPEVDFQRPEAVEPAIFPEEPVVEEPVAEEPVAEEPVAEEPVAEEPVAEEPVAEEPVAEEPVASADSYADYPQPDHQLVDQDGDTGEAREVAGHDESEAEGVSKSDIASEGPVELQPVDDLPAMHWEDREAETHEASDSHPEVSEAEHEPEAQSSSETVGLSSEPIAASEDPPEEMVLLETAELNESSASATSDLEDEAKSIDDEAEGSDVYGDNESVLDEAPMQAGAATSLLGEAPEAVGEVGDSDADPYADEPLSEVPFSEVLSSEADAANSEVASGLVGGSIEPVLDGENEHELEHELEHQREDAAGAELEAASVATDMEEPALTDEDEPLDVDAAGERNEEPSSEVEPVGYDDVGEEDAPPATVEDNIRASRRKNNHWFTSSTAKRLAATAAGIGVIAIGYVLWQGTPEVSTADRTGAPESPNSNVGDVGYLPEGGAENFSLEPSAGIAPAPTYVDPSSLQLPDAPSPLAGDASEDSQSIADSGPAMDAGLSSRGNGGGGLGGGDAGSEAAFNDEAPEISPETLASKFGEVAGEGDLASALPANDAPRPRSMQMRTSEPPVDEAADAPLPPSVEGNSSAEPLELPPIAADLPAIDPAAGSNVLEDAGDGLGAQAGAAIPSLPVPSGPLELEAAGSNGSQVQNGVPANAPSLDQKSGPPQNSVPDALPDEQMSEPESRAPEPAQASVFPEVSAEDSVESVAPESEASPGNADQFSMPERGGADPSPQGRAPVEVAPPVIAKREFGSPELRSLVSQVATNSYMLASEKWDESSVESTVSQLGQFLKPAGNRIPRAIDVPVATLSLPGASSSSVLSQIAESDPGVAQFFEPKEEPAGAPQSKNTQNIVLFTDRDSATSAVEAIGKKRGDRLLPAWVLKSKQKDDRVVVILQGVAPE